MHEENMSVLLQKRRHLYGYKCQNNIAVCSVGLLFNFYFSKYAMNVDSSKLPRILTQFYKDISM